MKGFNYQYCEHKKTQFAGILVPMIFYCHAFPHHLHHLALRETKLLDILRTVARTQELSEAGDGTRGATQRRFSWCGGGREGGRREGGREGECAA